MNVKELREWLSELPDESIVEHKFVSWSEIQPSEIRVIIVQKFSPTKKENS